MIRDISQPLHVGMPNWPGDTSFHAERTWHLSDKVPVNVSKVTFSTHAGSHADAPLHYAAGAPAIDGVDLSPYIGRAQVVGVEGGFGPIGPSEVLPRYAPGTRRVLLRTYSQAPTDRWDSEFRAVDWRLVDELAKRGVVLIGTDTPSLDPEQSKEMFAHKAILRHDIRVLEGLLLDNVPEGIYELVALPLKFVGLDASPVRAILRDLDDHADYS